jgi:hypothetical protein
MPTQLYLALYTVAPGVGDAGTEVSGGSYARQAVDFNAAALGSVFTTQTATIAFPDPTANWGQIVAWGLRDASSAGNLIYWDEPTIIRNVISGGQPYTVPVNQFVIVAT